MRIISGNLKGLHFPKFDGKNTRPTTDKCKESLFNTLENLVDFGTLNVLDLYSGLGSISLEFLSRNSNVDSVEINFKNIEYQKKIKNENEVDNWRIFKNDSIKFITQNDLLNYDLIFADPPYQDTGIFELIKIICEKIAISKKSIIFVLEHESKLSVSNNLLFIQRNFGDTTFSYYKNF